MVQKETKNRNWLNILTSFVAVMFVLSLFPGIAIADTPRERYLETKEAYQVPKEQYRDINDTDKEIKEPYRKMVEKSSETKEQYRETKDKYQTYKDQYKDAGDKFKDAEDRFKDARQNFRTSKDNNSRDKLKVRTGEYLGTGIDKMIAHLDVLKNRVEGSENNVLPFDAAANIDIHIAVLEEIRTNIQNAETAQEYVDLARDLKEQWAMIRLETRYAGGILINSKIDTFMAKSENVSARMDDAILNMETDGKDTAKLVRIAESFNGFMNEAGDNQQGVLDLYAIHDGFDDDGMVLDVDAAQSFLKEGEHSQKETHKILKDAIKDVREFFKEAKKHTTKRAKVNGNGIIEASGNGRVVIEGDVTVTLSAVNGTLVVSNNSEVTIDGVGTREELGNGNVKYEGFGSATISGDRIIVEISGNGIELTATGTGSAILNGNGTYKTEGDFGTGSGEWNEVDKI